MPRFETVIPAEGPQGNIMSIMGAARSMMRELGIEKEKIDDMSRRVMSAGSYSAACDVVREWFPLGNALDGK